MNNRDQDIDIETINILLIGEDEEKREAIQLINRYLQDKIVEQIKCSAPGLDGNELLDVYQEVLLSLYNAAKDGFYDPDKAHLLAFIFTLAKRRAIDRKRQRIPKPISEDELIEALGDRLADTSIGQVWQEISACELGQEMLRRIRKISIGLPKRQRQVVSVIIDHFPKYLELEEICSEIYKSTGDMPTVVAVKRARQEARKKIRKLLSKSKLLGAEI